MSYSDRPKSVIVADDDKSVRLVIAQALKKQGYVVHTTATAAGMWDMSVGNRGQLLITDVGFPDGDALDMLPRLVSRCPDIKVIVMSARANLLTAVKSQQQGVVDYLPKPFELKQLIDTTARAFANDSMRSPLGEIETPQTTYPALLGRSAQMQEVYKALAKLSVQTMPVLIEAELGSGKVDVAKALHDMGGTQNKPFIEMNCAQLPKSAHEASLFSQEGAFVKAAEGTLFINHIDALHPDAQLRLVAALEKQDGKGQAWPKRLLLGTVSDLRSAVASDDFREDLFFAISVAPLKLPALRYRKSDIPALANYFCGQMSAELSVKRSLSLSAISALQEYDWPGNIRELAFVLRKLIIASDHVTIEPDVILSEITSLKHSNVDDDQPQNSLSDAADRHIQDYFDALGDNIPHTGLYDRIMQEVERPLIIRTLYLTKGNQIKAAQILGLNRNTLRKKIEWLHISKDKKDYRASS